MVWINLEGRPHARESDGKRGMCATDTMAAVFSKLKQARGETEQELNGFQAETEGKEKSQR